MPLVLGLTSGHLGLYLAEVLSQAGIPFHLPNFTFPTLNV